MLVTAVPTLIDTAIVHYPFILLIKTSHYNKCKIENLRYIFLTVIGDEYIYAIIPHSTLQSRYFKI